MFHQKAALFLALCKWPLALACAAFLPATALSLFVQVKTFSTGVAHLWPIVIGVAAYMVLWYVLIRRTGVDFLSTLEHEITHCIFAWLTFNRVVALRATLKSGGHMRYLGTPNWLIQTAPYFFPTVTVAMMLAMSLMNRHWGPVMYGFLGASISYHVTSTWAETHHMQTDLQEAGMFFSVLFLPTANLLGYALIFAYLRLGLSGTTQVFKGLLHSPVNPMRFLN